MNLTLISKEHLVDNVWAFRFQPSEPLVWTAGQYVRVELESPQIAMSFVGTVNRDTGEVG